MSIIISLKKEEKIAILKIMIDINNFYNRVDSILPRGAEYIQKTANYLGIPNEISAAYNLPYSAASAILEQALKNDYAKEEFVSKILSILLLNKDTYGFKSFEKHCQDAIHLTKSFIRKCHFSHYTKDPISGCDYLLINDTTLNSQAIPELNTGENPVRDLGTINETLYKDL